MLSCKNGLQFKEIYIFILNDNDENWREFWLVINIILNDVCINIHTIAR